MTTAAPRDDSVDGAAGEKLPDTPTRCWAKTDATQQRILDAVTDVFAARRFTAATMADIVDHSDAGIGSIDHVVVDVGDQALEDRQEQPAHRAPFSNTVLKDRLPGSRRVCCGVRSVAGSPARCATSGHNMFRGSLRRHGGVHVAFRVWLAMRQNRFRRSTSGTKWTQWR